MRNADFNSSAGRLNDALKALEGQWMEAKESWDDSVSQRVEDDFLVPLHGQVRAMMDTVTKLAGVMAQAERECQHARERSAYL